MRTEPKLLIKIAQLFVVIMMNGCYRFKLYIFAVCGHTTVEPIADVSENKSLLASQVHSSFLLRYFLVDADVIFGSLAQPHLFFGDGIQRHTLWKRLSLPKPLSPFIVQRTHSLEVRRRERLMWDSAVGSGSGGNGANVLYTSAAS